MDFNQYRIVELLKEKADLLEALKREHLVDPHGPSWLLERTDCSVCQLIRRVEG